MKNIHITRQKKEKKNIHINNALKSNLKIEIINLKRFENCNKRTKNII